MFGVPELLDRAQLDCSTLAAVAATCGRCLVFQSCCAQLDANDLWNIITSVPSPVVGYGCRNIAKTVVAQRRRRQSTNRVGKA